MTGLHYMAEATFTTGVAIMPMAPRPTGGTPTSYFLAEGNLPPGLVLDGSTGLISGTPAAPGLFQVTVQAGNGSGAATETIHFTDLPAGSLTLAYPTPAAFTAGSAIAPLAPLLANATPGITTTYAASGLPQGLVLGADGTIAGNPVSAGAFTFTVTAANGARSATCQIDGLIHAAGTLTLTYAAPGTFTVGSPILPLAPLLANATPGLPSTYAASVLPQGLVLGADGVLNGTPAAAGAFTFTVTASNDARSASCQVSCLIHAAGTLTLTYAAPGAFTVGFPILPQVPLLANATPGLPTTYAASALPQGLVLGADGVLNGTPAAAGAFTFTMTATNDARSASCQVSCLIHAAGTLTLTYAAPGAFTVGLPILRQVPLLANATPGLPISYAASALPQGLVLGADGAITGTPATAGAFTFTVTASNDARSATCQVSCLIHAAGTLTLTYAAPGAFTVGIPILPQVPLLANATPGIPTTYAASALPQGLVLGADGVLSGTPAAAGAFTFTVTASNDARSATCQVSCLIHAAGTLTLTYAAPGAFTVGLPILRQAPLLANATPGLPISYAASALPQGLVLGADGAITGTPATAGAFTFTVTASNDARSASCQVSCLIHAAGTLTLTYPAPGAFTEGIPIPPQVPLLANATPGLLISYAAAALPQGLVLGADGAITGTPATAGPFIFTVTATNDARSATCQVSCLIQAAGTLTLSYPTPASFPVGSAIPPQAALLLNATPGLLTTYDASALPPGLVLGADGTITGSPGTLGQFLFTVTATSGARSATCQVSYLCQAAGTLTLSYGPVQIFTAGQAIALQPTVLVQPGPAAGLVFALASGALPPGLALAPEGSLAGIISAPGVYVFTVSVTAAGLTGLCQVVLSVSPLPIVPPPVIPLPLTGSLVPSTATPLFGASVTLVPTFSGGTATLGFTGVGSSEVTASAVSGAGVTTPALTDPKVYTLTVTSPGGAIISITCPVSPQTVFVAVPTPANQTVAPGSIPFSASVQGGLQGTVSWTASAGTIAPNGLWTSPNLAGTYFITATSLDDPTKSASTTCIVSLPLILTHSPTITVQPASQVVAVNDTPIFSVAANGTGPLSYQWYVVLRRFGATFPLGFQADYFPVPPDDTQTYDDGDRYYVVVSNAYGYAVSSPAQLAVGSGVLIAAQGQPRNAYLNVHAQASFQVTATTGDPANPPLAYQWYRAEPGSSAFAPIANATAATYVTDPAFLTDSGATFYCVVNNGALFSTTSATVGLFVGPLGIVGDFSSNRWILLGTNGAPTPFTTPTAGITLTQDGVNQGANLWWPDLLSTARLSITFNLTVKAGGTPGDGVCLLLADPSLGATTSMQGNPGSGFGAEGIPALALALDTKENLGGSAFVGVTRSDSGLWWSPGSLRNTSLATLATAGGTVTHAFGVTIADSFMTVTMDGQQVFSGLVNVPPVAYLGFSASGHQAQQDLSSLHVTSIAP